MTAPDDLPEGRSPEADALEVTDAAVGGAGIARDAAGRVVLIEGALPGERVRVERTGVRRGVERAVVVAVERPAPGRVDPPCAAYRAGCGGCDLQHLEPVEQPAWKAAIVVDALRRLAGLTDPPVTVGPVLPALGYRTTVRAAVRAGVAGFRRARSHEVVVGPGCPVAHPALDELLVEGRFGDADEVVLRTGVATGERMAVVHPTTDGVILPPDVIVVGTDELRAGRRAWFHEEVGGRRYRVSAQSFFQSRPDGAGALVEAVMTAAGPAADGAGTVIDAYAGIGLFAAALAERGGQGVDRRVVAVERSASSAADARVNLAGLPARVVKVAVERFRTRPADLVVADPARSGLGAAAVRALVAARSPVFVLVSCDPAALARDVTLLADAGYRLDAAHLVDLFPQTHHVEVVSRFLTPSAAVEGR
jgi:23S rRNA (uracil1939-C5)-methyltransferase